MKNPKVTDTREFWKGGKCRERNKAAGGLNQRDLGHILALMLSCDPGKLLYTSHREASVSSYPERR